MYTLICKLSNGDSHLISPLKQQVFVYFTLLSPVGTDKLINAKAFQPFKEEPPLKLIHLSDLHLGKRVNEFSLIDDQKYILQQILSVIREEDPDAVIIAGDVYDKPTPSSEAVNLLDDFLSDLHALCVSVLIISGNHDSAERLPFAGRILKDSRIFIAPTYHGDVTCVDLEDEFGTVHFWLLPFIKPIHVRACHPDVEINSYNDAMKIVLDDIAVDLKERNVLVTHQFVSGAERCDSEELSVGGTDQIDLDLLGDFHYVALGHLHRPQTLGSAKKVRYCGSPLKYSFSETSGNKSVTVVTLDQDGNVDISLRELSPMRDMVELKGTYDELTALSFYDNTSYRDDYVHITLTDEEDIPDALGRLRAIYHNIMKLDYDNHRTRALGGQLPESPEILSPMDLFRRFYSAQNGSDLSEEQASVVEGMIEKIWEGEP